MSCWGWGMRVLSGEQWRQQELQQGGDEVTMPPSREGPELSEL